MIARVVLAALLAAVPVLIQSALAQSDSACRGDARNVDRELALRADRLSPGERLQAQQRLSRAEGLCTQDSIRAGQDLEQLRRDMVQQATRPSDLPPGLPPPGPSRD